MFFITIIEIPLNKKISNVHTLIRLYLKKSSSMLLVVVQIGIKNINRSFQVAKKYIIFLI